MVLPLKKSTGVCADAIEHNISARHAAIAQRASDRNLIVMRSPLLFPSPLWGDVRGGGRASCTTGAARTTPSPTLPTRGREKRLFHQRAGLRGHFGRGRAVDVHHQALDLLAGNRRDLEFRLLGLGQEI